MTRPPIEPVSARTVYQNRWMTLSEHRIRRSDNSEGIYGLVEKPDFALVIPSDRDGFHLITQYRYPIHRHSLEFPQGTSETENLKPVDLAQAELIEELGLRAQELDHLGIISPAAGTSNQWCHVYLATDFQPDTSRSPDPEEQDLRRSWLSRTDFETKIRSGEIIDAATIAAYSLMLLQRP